MSDTAEPGTTFEIEEQSQPSLLRRMPWWLIGSIAFAIGEVTTHHPLGIVVLCLKFGWNDFLIGLWLRRRDPDRTRGAVCSLFYWALGLWRVGMWSFALLFTFILVVFVLLEEHLQNGNDPIEISLCAMIMLGSVVLALGTTLFGILRGWTTRQRIWLSSSIHDSCRRREWPPVVVEGTPNLLKRIVIMTGCITIAALSPVVIILGITLLNPGEVRPRHQNGGGAGLFGAIVGVGFPIGGAVMVLLICSSILKRLAADRPDQCWTPTAEQHFSVSPESDDNW